jgi:hypothetical protein
MRQWRDRGCRSIVPCTALPSNGDGWLLDGGCMLLWRLLWLERQFGGRFGPSKCVTVGLAIQGSSTSTFGSNRLESMLEKQCGGSPVDQWCGKGVGPSGDTRWRQSMWHYGPRPPATSTCLLCTPFVYICEFSCIQIIFSSTSGTRWIVNINWHMWCCFTLVLCGMLIVKMGVSDHQQAPPSYPFARPEQICGFRMLGSGVASM